MRDADAQIYGAYLLMYTWMGDKVPRFEKVLGRKTADRFKNDALGRTERDNKILEKQFLKLKAKIEARHNGKR